VNAMTTPAAPASQPSPGAPDLGNSGASWQLAILEALRANRMDTVIHVPDLVLADLIRMIEQDAAVTVYAPAKEEEGIGIACGAYLGGRRAVVLMQNSGMGNVVNALASMALPYQIPFLILISQRGELNEFNAAQVGMAQVLRPMLGALGVPHFTLEQLNEVRPTLDGATALAFSTERPVAIILSPLLTGGKKGL
jgi:sulfopyruvate decarboxylase alpha subunit